jgi:hypothetical protein
MMDQVRGRNEAGTPADRRAPHAAPARTLAISRGDKSLSRYWQILLQNAIEEGHEQ